MELAEPPTQPALMSTAPASRALLVWFVSLCVLGLVVSTQLTRIHVLVHTDPSYHSICAVSEGVNCETVAESPYSVFLGLPVAVWGLIGYFVMGYVALTPLLERHPHSTWPWGILLVLANFAVAVSALLAYVAATRIRSLCLFCMASYLLNVALLITCAVAVRRTRASVIDLVHSDARLLLSKRAALGLSLPAAAAVALPVTFVPPYWSNPRLSDLTQVASGTNEQGHHWIGGTHSILTIVEFSDYECPHCRAAHRKLRSTIEAHPGEIRLIHRHLPLDASCNPSIGTPFHQYACIFAEAAECAGKQGRFWEMNDALFSIQEKTPASDVSPLDLAARLGLSRAEFQQCMDRHAMAPVIENDVREALGHDMQGTPTYLIDNKIYLGGVPESQLDQLLQSQHRGTHSSG